MHASPLRYGFLLIEGFALMSAASAVEPLRAANLLGQRTLYETSYLSRDGGQVRSSCGAGFDTLPMAQSGRLDLLFVVAGGNPLAYEDAQVFAMLRRWQAEGVALGGISGGSAILARAGVLHNRRFTVHWEHFEALRAGSEAYLMERRLFVVDRDRYTCAGGVAPLDLMHALIRAQQGAKLAREVSDWFIHTGVRQAEDPQRSRVDDIGTSGLRASVRAAQDLMETHLADPLTMVQLAQLVGRSTRSLQRDFLAQTGAPIMRHYLALRLQKADELLRQTRLPVGEVALATGFATQAHFARVYRTRFGLSPRARRG